MAATSTTDLAAFNTYAHSATTATDRFADHAANKASYLKRLTYGFSQMGDASKPAVVPKGAEVLLETRLPYLDASQRRVVLKTTALASGYPAMDDAEGWGRLNLFNAADGYGAFNGDVVVSMDASLGGFNAADAWRNDIAGAGKLTKQGSGALSLSGSNSYTGGTEIVAGTLQASSATALGKGDVYLGGGSLACQASAALMITGGYTQRADTTLALTLGSGTAGRLNVSGTVTLDGGTLTINFPAGYKPAVGDTLNVISAGSLHGNFKTITVDGYKVTPTYNAKGLLLHIDA
jgi:autotransporter-associated beta strand protein